MKKILILILAITTFSQVKAQQEKGNSINISIGYGLSSVYDDVDITGKGFYLQGEYVIEIKNWLDVRPYAGLILTKSDENQFNYKSDANAVLIGGKGRITAPIPYISPYIELGIGTSIGSFKTITDKTNLNKSGLVFHIPVTLGIEIGKNRKFDFAFTYYFHPDAEQFSGAAAVGLSFPLN